MFVSLPSNSHYTHSVSRTANRNHRSIRFFLQLLHKLSIHPQHRRSSLRVPLIHILLSQLRSTLQATILSRLWMRQIHHKPSRNHSKVIAATNQVMQPRDFVEAVVHKTLVERGQHARALHHHVGLLDRVEPARNQRVVKRTIRKKPLFVEIVLKKRKNIEINTWVDFFSRYRKQLWFLRHWINSGLDWGNRGTDLKSTGILEKKTLKRSRKAKNKTAFRSQRRG